MTISYIKEPGFTRSIIKARNGVDVKRSAFCFTCSQVLLMTVYFYFSMKMNGNANGELTLDTIESCV